MDDGEQSLQQEDDVDENNEVTERFEVTITKIASPSNDEGMRIYKDN